ncbi:MAG: ABC transporter permease subunit [Acidimicrobiales bacterium]
MTSHPRGASVMLASRFLLDRRRSLVWWSAGLVGLVLFTVALFPTIAGQEAFDDLATDLPEAARSLLGIDQAVPLTSPPGYLHGRLFAGLLPFLLLVFGVGLGAYAVAGSEQDGTLELVLANPVTRRAVGVQRYLAVVALLGLLTSVFAAALVGLGLPFGVLEGVPATGLAGACAGAFAIALVHATVAFSVGAATGRRAWASAAAGSLGVAGYLLQGLLSLSPAVRPLRLVSPWHWYLGRNMLANGVAPDALIVPVVVSLVLAGVGIRAFLRRDLR